MRPSRLLALYPRQWRQRYGAELAGLLDEERLTLHLVIDLIRGAIDAHLHPELVAPLLATAGGGTVRLPPRSPRLRAYVLVVVLLLLLVFGGLYAVRAQTPAEPQVPLTEVLSEVYAGSVTRLEITDGQVTVTLRDGRGQRTAVGAAGNDLLRTTVMDYNRANPTKQVQLDYRADQSPLSLILPLLVGWLVTLLPIALLALLILLLANRLARRHGTAEHAARYGWLTRIADLRDRGVLTEEEFEREKRRLLE